MIELVRFVKTMDREDVPLAEPVAPKVEKYESGDWLVPVGQGAGTLKTEGWMEATEADDANTLTDNDIRMAKLVWFEKGRPDALHSGKYTVIHGSETRIKTDCYDESLTTYAPGVPLTIKKSANGSRRAGKFVLAPAGNNDVIKAICYEKPDSKSLLTFELV